jgi:hypothetical protein
LFRDYGHWIADVLALTDRTPIYREGDQVECLVASRKELNVGNFGATASHLVILAPKNKTVRLTEGARAVVYGYRKDGHGGHVPTFTVNGKTSDADKVVGQLLLTSRVAGWIVENRPKLRGKIDRITAFQRGLTGRALERVRAA